MREYLYMFSKKDKKIQAALNEGGGQDVYQRQRWKHAFRLLSFILVLVLDGSFVTAAYHSHMVAHNDFHAREFFGYFMLAICNMILLPSIALEVDKIVITPEKMVLHNLFWHFSEKWDELKSFKRPAVLKFSILIGKKFVYLLNKRDFERYDELVETIEHKAAQLQK